MSDFDSDDDSLCEEALLQVALMILKKRVYEDSLLSSDDSDDDDDDTTVDDEDKVVDDATGTTATNTTTITRSTRSKRKKYDYEAARKHIEDKVICANPTIPFNKTYRISLEHFQAIFHDFQHKLPMFGETRKFFFGGEGACPEVRMLLPLHCLAFGTAPSCHLSTYQVSSAFAANCCKMFDKAMKELYGNVRARFSGSVKGIPLAIVKNDLCDAGKSQNRSKTKMIDTDDYGREGATQTTTQSFGG